MVRPFKPIRLIRWRHTPHWQIKDKNKTMSTGTPLLCEARKILSRYQREKIEPLSRAPLWSEAKMKATLLRTISRSKERSIKKGLDFDLTYEAVSALMSAQKGLCALTEIEMNLTRSRAGRSRPFAPSIDRIDNGRGYTMDNIRIVCAIANLARGDFSDAEFVAMCEGVVQRVTANNLLKKRRRQL